MLLPPNSVGRVLVLAGALSMLPVPAAARQPAGERSIRLYGVIRQQSGGIALLRFGAGRPRSLRPGESHRGFTLVEVFSDRVLLESPEGAALRIGFPESDRPPAPPDLVEVTGSLPGSLPAPPGPAVESDPVPTDDGLEMAAAPPEPSGTGDGGGERRFSRSEVRLRLQTELPRILQTAVVAPRVRGNEVIGLELVSFPQDTVLGETGLVPGDVLLQVNGRDVRGMESLAVLAQRFQTARELELKVDRGGEVVSFRYRIE